MCVAQLNTWCMVEQQQGDFAEFYEVMVVATLAYE
jgi:hypothetical protein